MDDIGQIIGSLTPAERKAMLANDAHSVDSLLALNPRLAKRLHSKGLMYLCMSPYGMEVSARLKFPRA